MGDDKDEKYLDPGQNPFIQPGDPEPEEGDEDQVESDGLAPFVDLTAVDIEALTEKIKGLSQGRHEFELGGKKITLMASGTYQVDGRGLADLGLADLAAFSLILNNR